MRVFLSGIRKLLRRPASLVTFGLVAGLLLLIFVAVGATARELPGEDREDILLLVTFPGAYELVLGFILGLGGLLAIVYGAAIAGSEWTWGTLKASVARGEGRTWYLLGTFAAVAVMVGLGLLLAYVVGILGALAGAVLANVSTAGINDTEILGSLPEEMLRSWVALTEQAALGFAVATVARSQLAGIGVGIAAYFAEQFASLFIRDIVKYLPFNAANAAVAAGPGTQTGGQIVPSLPANEALLVVLAWLVGSLVVASLFTERAEIGG